MTVLFWPVTSTRHIPPHNCCSLDGSSFSGPFFANPGVQILSCSDQLHCHQQSCHIKNHWNALHHESSSPRLCWNIFSCFHGLKGEGYSEGEGVISILRKLEACKDSLRAWQVCKLFAAIQQQLTRSVENIPWAALFDLCKLIFVHFYFLPLIATLYIWSLNLLACQSKKINKNNHPTFVGYRYSIQI